VRAWAAAKLRHEKNPALWLHAVGNFATGDRATRASAAQVLQTCTGNHQLKLVEGTFGHAGDPPPEFAPPDTLRDAVLALRTEAPVCEGLGEALGDTVAYHSDVALLLLGVIASASCAPALEPFMALRIEALCSVQRSGYTTPDRHMAAVLYALERAGAESLVSVLDTILSHAESHMLNAAAAVLGRLGTDEAVAVLARHAQWLRTDPNDAYESLRFIGSSRGFDSVRALLTHDNHDARRCALCLLASSKIPERRAMLLAHAEREQDTSVAEYAARMIRQVDIELSRAAQGFP